ncbi:hypothetical protein ACKKBG_A37375 [Auxenochlorella protothecoides x Auxenochlorella symbiontica]
MFQPGAAEPLRLNMEPLSSAGSLRRPSQTLTAEPVEPLPERWQAALRNLDTASTCADSLASALDEALYLDTMEWQRAVPASQQHQAKQSLLNRVRALETLLTDCRGNLAASEKLRREGEARVQELEGELENNAQVFRLHYEALLDKDQTISDLQAVISALSLGSIDQQVEGGPGRAQR